MKFILVLISLFFSYVVYAQPDTEVPKNDKPSWSSKLPDRNDAPEMDTEEDDELSGLTMDRSALFSDDDEGSSVLTEDNSDAISLENESVTEQEKQAEADTITEQEKQAQAAKIAEQEAQADKIAEQEKQAEADRIAKQKKIAEDQKRAAEKRALEQEQVTDNTTVSTEKNQKVQPRAYTWKKTKSRAPEYPVKAARDGKEGWVDVEFTIDNTGKVIGAHPIRTSKNSKLFNKSALRAVRQWRFDPPSNYGIKLNQTKTVRVVFNLAK